MEKELDINGIFNDLICIEKHNLISKCYPIQFDVDNIKELFEFLLQLFEMLCKYFFGDSNNKVNLEALTDEDFAKINKYFNAIGFICKFDILPANANNINYAYTNRYDRLVGVTNIENLDKLLFGILCKDKIYIIQFSIL